MKLTPVAPTKQRKPNLHIYDGQGKFRAAFEEIQAKHPYLSKDSQILDYLLAIWRQKN